jgi:hypothetical protein
MYENNIESVAVVRRIIIGSHPIETTAKNIMCQVELLDCCSIRNYTRDLE